MTVLTKVYFRPPVEFVPGLREKKQENWWSNRVSRTTSPIFNQSISGLLQSIMHLSIYYIKQAYEFVYYICNFKASKN